MELMKNFSRSRRGRAEGLFRRRACDYLWKAYMEEKNQSVGIEEMEDALVGLEEALD